MLAWLKRLLNPICPECARLHAVLAEKESSHKAIVAMYEGRLQLYRDNEAYRDRLTTDTINELRQERDLLRETLFRVARLNPPPLGLTDIAKGEARPGNPKQVTSHRNWNETRQVLERAHRKPNDEKLKHWQEVNAKAESEIPELAEALKAKTEEEPTSQFMEDMKELAR